MPRLLQALVRIAFAAFFAILFGLTVCWLLLAIVLQIGNSDVVLVIVACIPLYYVAVLIHELGHLIAAKAVKFPITRFLVGSFQVLRVGGQFRFGLIKPWGHLSGLVEASPTNDRSLRGRLAVLIAAGPWASLVGFAVCLAVAFALNERIMDEWAYFRRAFWHRLLQPRNATAGWFYLVAILNLTISFGELIPGDVRGYMTDGAQLLDLLIGGRITLSRTLIAILVLELRKGIRPRNWDPARVERLLSLRTGSAKDSVVNLFGYYYHLDLGLKDEADEFLDLAVAQRSSWLVNRKAIYVEVAYFEGFHRRNAKAARHWFHRIENGGLEAHTELRAEAATLLAEGRYEEASMKAEAALTVLPRSADPGGAKAEADWLREILEEARNGGRI